MNNNKSKVKKQKVKIKGDGNQVIQAIGGATVTAYNYVRKKVNLLTEWQKAILSTFACIFIIFMILVSVNKGNIKETLQPVVEPMRTYIFDSKKGDEKNLISILRKGKSPQIPCAQIGMSLNSFLSNCENNYKNYDYTNYTVGSEASVRYEDWSASFQNNKLVELNINKDTLKQYTKKEIEEILGESNKVKLKDFNVEFYYENALLKSIIIRQSGLKKLQPEYKTIGGTNADLPLSDTGVSIPVYKMSKQKLSSIRQLVSQNSLKNLIKLATQGDAILQSCGRVGTSTLSEVIHQCGNDFESLNDRKPYVDTYGSMKIGGRIQILNYNYGTHKVSYYFLNEKLLVIDIDLMENSPNLKFQDIRRELGEEDNIGRTGRIENYYDFQYSLGVFTLIFKADIPSQDPSQANDCFGFVITNHPEIYHGIRFGWI